MYYAYAFFTAIFYFSFFFFLLSCHSVHMYHERSFGLRIFRRNFDHLPYNAVLKKAVGNLSVQFPFTLLCGISGEPDDHVLIRTSCIRIFKCNLSYISLGAPVINCRRCEGCFLPVSISTLYLPHSCYFHYFFSFLNSVICDAISMALWGLSKMRNQVLMI